VLLGALGLSAPIYPQSGGDIVLPETAHTPEGEEVGSAMDAPDIYGNDGEAAADFDLDGIDAIEAPAGRRGQAPEGGWDDYDPWADEVAPKRDPAKSPGPVDIPPPPSEQELVPEVARSIKRPEVVGAAIHRAWAARRRALERLELGAARKAEEELVKLKETLGVVAMPAYSLALLREVDRDLEQGEVSAAAEHLALAERLSPGLPLTAAFRAKVAQASGAEGEGAAGEVLDSWRLRLGDRASRSALLINGAVNLIVGLLIACLVGLMVLAARRLRYLYHDLHDLFPFGASRAQTLLVMALILAAPLFLGLGPVVVVGYLAALLWAYCSLRERVVLATLVTIVGFAPALIGWAGGGVVELEGPARWVHKLERTADWAVAARLIDRRVEAGEASAQELLALARWHKREGRLERARALYQKGLELAPTSGEGHNNLGVVYVAQGAVAKAKEEFQLAIELAPKLAEPHHNLAKIYFRMTDLGAGEQSRARAIALDPEIMERSPDDDGRLNVGLIDAPMPTREIEALARAERPLDDAGHQLQARLAGVLPPSTWGVAPFLGLVLLLLGAGVSSGLRTARPCQRCGRSACGRCDSEVGKGAECAQCVNAFRRESKVSPQVRAAKEASIRRFQKLRRFASYVFGAVAPGSGQMILGRTVIGFIFLTLFSLCVTGAVISLDWVPDPFPIASAPASFRTALLGGAAGLIYLTSLWHLRRIKG